jgi:hypothetical protein
LTDTVDNCVLKVLNSHSVVHESRKRAEKLADDSVRYGNTEKFESLSLFFIFFVGSSKTEVDRYEG